MTADHQTFCIKANAMMAFSSTITLRRQLDRSDVSAEIALIHLAILRQTVFSVGFNISVDSITSPLPL